MTIGAAGMEVVNQALIALEAEPLADLSEDTTETRVVAALYEPAVRYVLAAHSWQAALTAKTLAAEAGATPQQYRYAYALPADCLAPVQILGSGHAWTKIDDTVETDAAPCRLQYVRRLSETAWPPYLKELILRFLTAKLCAPITGSSSRAEALLDRWEARDLPRARRHDAKHGTQTVQADTLVAIHGW